MGIDIYAKWDGQSAEEASAQITGYSTTSGALGYLREAYHGGPYVTNWLVPEAFIVDNPSAREFFSGGVEQFMGQIAEALGGFSTETPLQLAHRAGDGFPPEGYVVSVPTVEVVNPAYPDEEASLCAAIPAALLERRLPLCEALYATRCAKVYDCEPVAEEWRSFVDFVALVRAKEDAGLHPSVYASY